MSTDEDGFARARDDELERRAHVEAAEDRRADYAPTFTCEKHDWRGVLLPCPVCTARGDT